MDRDKEVLNEFNPTLLHHSYFALTKKVIFPVDISGTLEPVLLNVSFSTERRQICSASVLILRSRVFIDTISPLESTLISNTNLPDSLLGTLGLGFSSHTHPDNS